jgi:outer membrane protein TolC
MFSPIHFIKNLRKVMCVSFASFVCLSAFSNNIFANSVSQYNSSLLSFEQAIKIAQKNDPWLTGNEHQQRAISAMSQVANTLPDPKMSLTFANLPTDGFDFSQERMTQLKVGFTQVFPRGESLRIKHRQLRLQSQAYPFQRQDRKSKVAVTVGSLWLDIYHLQQSIILIEKNRALFEQLADIAQASYSAALGKTRQQDVVRAQIELTRLEDRKAQLLQQQNHSQGLLSQWLNDLAVSSKNKENMTSMTRLTNFQLSQKLPEIILLNSALVYSDHTLSVEKLANYFTAHPAIIALDKKVLASETGVNLAQQQYQPEWGINASYGYRADDPMGDSRADLLSFGVTFDLPLFTENRQDMAVKSAISQTETVKTERILLLRQLLGAYASGKGRLLRSNERKSLYKNKLLPQIQDQVAASLSAYTNDDGDFAEVVRARIALLNAEIDHLAITVEQQKILLALNYLFIGRLTHTDSAQITSPDGVPYELN